MYTQATEIEWNIDCAVEPPSMPAGVLATLLTRRSALLNEASHTRALRMPEWVHVYACSRPVASGLALALVCT